MKALVLSDIHLEWHKDYGQSFVKSIDSTDIDVLILAGDVFVWNYITCRESFINLCAKFPFVVYVPGNHEYYNRFNPRGQHKEIQLLESLCPSLHILDNSLVEYKSARFLGSTLWFPYRQDESFAEMHMNDFYEIQGFRSWVYDHHAKSVEWLQQNIKVGDVVVSHHLPSWSCISAQFQNSPLNIFFASNQDSIIYNNKPSLWVHAHSHDSLDIMIGSTRVLRNPFGYYGGAENSLFNPNLIVEI